jgi:hypothetical protein
MKTKWEPPLEKYKFEEFPETTKNFLDEIVYRTEMIFAAFEILNAYPKIKDYEPLSMSGVRDLHAILKRDIALNFAALIDKKSPLSIRLEANKDGTLSINKRRMKKLLEGLPLETIKIISYLLEEILNKNKTVIKKLISSRNNRLAHSGIVYHKIDRKNFLSNFRFPKKKLYRMSICIRWIIIYPILDGGISENDRLEETIRELISHTLLKKLTFKTDRFYLREL